MVFNTPTTVEELNLETSVTSCDLEVNSVEDLTFDQDLTTEPYISGNFTRFIKEARIEVDINTKEYGLLFQRTGNWGSGSTAKGTYDRVFESNGKWVLARRDELLMPGQGFIIMFVPNRNTQGD